jgi:hypothetical protein
MPNFAVIDDKNIVVNVIVAETKQDAEEATGKTCIQSDYAFIGAQYNEETQLFIDPNYVEPAEEETL